MYIQGIVNYKGINKMIKFYEDKIREKFERIKKEYVEPYEADIDIERGATLYSKDNIELDNNFSMFITPHIDKGKILYKQPRKSIPKNGNPEEYHELVFDKEGKLHHMILDLGTAGFISETFFNAKNAKYVSFFVSDNLRIDCMLRIDDKGKIFKNWNEFEWSEYDEEGRLISVELFKDDSFFSGGFKVDAEYYEYTDGVLSCIDQYKDFSSDLPAKISQFAFSMMPDRIYNPNFIEYTFEKDCNDINCTKNYFFRKSQTITHNITIKEDELIKMKEYGIYLI